MRNKQIIGICFTTKDYLSVFTRTADRAISFHAPRATRLLS